MNKDEAMQCLTYKTIGTSRDTAILVLKTVIDSYNEVAAYYGQLGFYGENKKDGEESVYWKTNADLLEDFLKKYTIDKL